ncbi:MAG: XRE family transcriptional regulator [Salinibacterium sp.]|nr:MAG: XRE family transcriptional regulator [Salinibacterium sp.]
MTGLQLKVERTKRRVRVTDLARVMNVTHARVSQIEGQAVVTDDAAEKYLKALSTFLAQTVA